MQTLLAMVAGSTGATLPPALEQFLAQRPKVRVARLFACMLYSAVLLPRLQLCELRCRARVRRQRATDARMSLLA